MRYFDVLGDDDSYADRWFLDDPLTKDGEEIDAREFRYGRFYDGPRPIHLPIDQEGRSVQFLLAASDMPVVTDEVARIVEGVAPGEVECFPVTVGPDHLTGYVILNVICREACVDEQRTEVSRWKKEDFCHPDRIGRLRVLSNLTIDPSRTHDRHIFRVEDYVIALIVSRS